MIKKVLTYSIVITTVVWSVGLLATPLAVGAAVSGDLIKLTCAAGAEVNDPCKAVYYLGGDGKRYVFPNEKTYNTWYSDFLSVDEVSDTEMSSYTIGGNVTYRPGVKLVKIQTDPKVYAVAGDGTLMWVSTGDLAEEIYGADWASMIEDVPDAFFVNYTVGSDIDEASDYNKSDQTDASPTINDDKDLSGDGTVSTGTSLTVALAADTPASGLIVGSSINNKFTKVDLTAAADGDIIVDQVVVRRGGTIASDGAFSSIALIDVATNQRIGNTKSINSTHKAVFNKDFTVPAGTTKSIYLVGNMVSSLGSTAGEIPQLVLESITLSGSAAVIGTLPIAGNYQTLNGSITIGTLTVANGSNNPSAATQRIGSSNYIVSGFKLTSNSVEDFIVTQINFNQGGTASDGDVGTLDLFVDDALYATVAEPNDGNVFFDLSANPVTVAKGKIVQFDLQLDILDGSDRSIRFDVKDESDVVAKGDLYGAEVKVAAGSGASADADPFWTAPITTIDRGALRISSATLSNENIPEDVTQVVLAKFTFDASGEAVEITALPIHFLITTSTGNLGTDSTVDLTNITVYDENGLIVAGPDDPTEKYFDVGGVTKTKLLGVTTTDTITVPAGQHVYTIKGDLDTDFGTNDTIVAHIKPGQLSARGETTGLAVTPTPSGSEQTSATMTVKTAALSLSVSPQPGAMTVVAGTDQHIFANLVLGAESSGEDVKITKIAVRVECDVLCNPAEVSNWTIYDGSTVLDVTNDPDSITDGLTDPGDDATSTFLLSTPLIIAKGTSKTLTVKGDIDNDAADGVMTVGMSDGVTANHITAKGNDSGQTAAISLSKGDGSGQTFTNTGTLVITEHADDPDSDFLISRNQSGIEIATFIAVARYEAIEIEKIYVEAGRVNSGGLDQVTDVHLYVDGEWVRTVTPTSTDANNKFVLFDLTNNEITVPQDDSVKISIKVDTPEVDYTIAQNPAGKPTSWQGFQMKITRGADVTAKGAQSGNTVVPTVTSAQGQNVYLVRTFPTITISEPKGVISTGTNTETLSTFTVSADSKGDVMLGKVQYYISTSTATLTNVFLYQGNTKVATASTTILTDNNAGSGYTSLVDLYLTTSNGPLPSYQGTVVTNLMPSQARIPAGTSKTYSLRGDIECNAVNCNKPSSATGGTVNVKFLSDSSQVGEAPVTLAAYFNDPTTLRYEYSILWSDLWRTPILQRSSSTATNTEQWLNGYLMTDGSGVLDATSTGAKWNK